MTKPPVIVVIATMWMFGLAFYAGYWRAVHAVAQHADLGKVFERMTNAIDLACRMSGAEAGELVADVKLHANYFADPTVSGEFRNVPITCREAWGRANVVIDTHNFEPKVSP